MEICMKAANTARLHAKLAREMCTTQTNVTEAVPEPCKTVHSYARLAVAIGHRSLSEICHSENGIYARRCSQSSARLDSIEDFDCDRWLA